MSTLEADFIVVGAGTSGSLIARRVVERTDASVLLVESGPRYPRFPLDVPLAGLSLRRPWSWSHESVSQVQLQGRKFSFPMGRVVGGSSSVNAMICVPGMPQAFDQWREAGCDGWGGDEMMRVFGLAAAPGGRAPMGISEARHRAPFSEAFVEACVEYGLQQTPMLFGNTSNSCGWFPVFQRQGKRQSAGPQFLGDVRQLKRFRMLTRKDVRRVVLEKGRATGVEFFAGRKRVRAHATQGVILAAGALSSPALLLRSGVGPADELRTAGVNVEVDLMGVGKNLQDHFGVPLVFESTQPSPGRKSRWLLSALQYLWSRNGVMASTCGEVGCFLAVDQEIQESNIELFAMIQTNRAAQAIELMCILSEPKSSGTIRLNPDDPWGASLIDPNYLSHPRDWDFIIKGMNAARGIVHCPALRNFGLTDEVLGKGRSDRELIAAEGTTFHHPVGGCCMRIDQQAVVDPCLRVQGVERLWVADNSIVPAISNAHTASLALMIGERASDLILAESSSN